MNIKVVICGDYQTNCYLIEKEGKLLVVDPGEDAPKIIKAIEEIGIIPSAILLTHGHFDHISSVDKLVEKFSISEVYIHPEDKHYFVLPEHNLSAYSYNPVILKTKPISILDNTLNIDGIEIEVIETPGHTQGGVCYLIDDCLFSGDTIFFETIGRTDMPNGKHSLLLKSLQRLLNKLDSSISIFPGHGEETSVEHEKKYNPFYKMQDY